jgi:formylglycine-generating enzyme required for sulfatase activity
MINVHDAANFCEWLTTQYPELGTFRIPTLREWLIAAYGKDRKYPWGNEWSDTALCFTWGPPEPKDEYSTEHYEWELFEKKSPEPVKWRPAGKTPEGVYGMWGNVAEFVSHPAHVANGVFTFVGARWLGGSYEDKEFDTRQDYWGYSHDSHIFSQRLGFRVVLDVMDKEHKYKHETPYNLEVSW